MVVGSPRRGGNTELLLAAAAQGARDRGASVDTVYLGELSIAPCRACNECRPGGRCVIEDDMQPLYDKMREAAGFIFGTPVYWFGPSAQLKAFVDRWYAISRERDIWRRKPLGLVITHASSSEHMASAARDMFTSIARYLEMPIAGAIGVSASGRGAVADDPSALARAREIGNKVAAAAARAGVAGA